MGRVIGRLALCVLLLSGLGMAAAEDEGMSLEEARRLADQGNTAAQYFLGSMYDFGKGVPQDDAEAAMWYRRAAQQGHAKAQHRLGSMYANGEGVPQDDAAAAMWYRRAAQREGMLQDDAVTQTDDKAAYYQRLLKLHREQPARYEEERRLFTLFAQMLLGRLGYDAGSFDGVLGDRTEAALRRYEANRRLPVTGDPLSFETSNQLTEDYAALDHQVFDLPKLVIHIDDWDRGYVYAQGTWTMQGDNMQWPEQTSKIECSRRSGFCNESTAIAETSIFGAGERHLSIDVETYAIERWDDIEVVTRPSKTAHCVQKVLRISRIQESVASIRSRASADELCDIVLERYLVLVDGAELSKKLRKKQSETWRNLMQISPRSLPRLGR